MMETLLTQLKAAEKEANDFRAQHNIVFSREAAATPSSSSSGPSKSILV